MRVLLIALLALLFLQGCSNSYKKELLKEELKSELEDSTNPILEKEPIEIVEVDAQNFEIINESVPDKQMIRQIKIMGAELDDVISLLTEATGENIIFQLQSESRDRSNNSRTSSRGIGTSSASLARYAGSYGSSEDEREIRTSKVFLSAQNIGFGRALNRAIGDKLSVRYDDDTYYIGYVRTVTLKIPSLSGLASKLKQSLETMGALNVAHDTISSSITFSAREREYQDIMRYLELLRDNLYVIEYDMAIYNVELNDNFNLGINWNLLPTGDDTSIVSKTSAAFGSVGASTTASTLGAVFKTSNISGTLIAEALAQFGKVESVQRPRLLGIAGTDVTLVDGLDEPYIKELRTTALGDRATQTSTVSASALSGIRVTLNSNIMDDTVLSDISIEINDIVGYSNFTVDNISYTQPKTQTKSIKNSMRVQPGVPIIISGLFRNKSDKGYKGIPGVDVTPLRLVGGSEYDGSKKSEMVIIVTPQI
ncbi:MAG: hypothetical protein WCR69_00770 [Sulfuricurvum sp.]